MLTMTWLLAAAALTLIGSAAMAQNAAQTVPATSPTANVLRPREGETWAVDSVHEIAWVMRGSGEASSAEISVSFDGGKTWEPVGKSDAGATAMRWKVPDKVGKKVRLRIALSRGPTFESDLFSIIPSQEVKSYKWTKVTTEGPFAGRDGAGALTYKGKMYLLGGWNPGDKVHFPRICNNEVWSSVNGKDWTLEKPNTYLDKTFDPASDWEGRHTAGYVIFKDKMWIVGGDGNQGYMIHDTWNSSDGKKWTRVSGKETPPWAPRILHYTVAFKDWIWVMGGQTLPQFAPADQHYYSDVWRTKDGVKWEQVTPKAPWHHRGQIGHSAVFKGRIWILGGGTYDTPTQPQRLFFHDVWSSEDGVNWECHVENAPWEPRQYHDVAVWDDKLWVLEGYYKANRKDCWYSADGVNWYEVPNTPWPERHAASPFVHDGSLWMVVGNNMTPDVWRLTK